MSLSKSDIFGFEELSQCVYRTERIVVLVMTFLVVCTDPLIAQFIVA